MQQPRRWRSPPSVPDPEPSQPANRRSSPRRQSVPNRSSPDLRQALSSRFFGLPSNQFQAADNVRKNPHVPRLISRLIHRRLRDEHRLGKSLIVQQTPERLGPDRTFTDMLMPVQLRPARRLGVVAVPHLDSLKPDRLGDQPGGLRIALRRPRYRSRPRGHGRCRDTPLPARRV